MVQIQGIHGFKYPALAGVKYTREQIPQGVNIILVARQKTPAPRGSNL